MGGDSHPMSRYSYPHTIDNGAGELVLVGTLLARYRGYADAPEPIRLSHQHDSTPAPQEAP